VWGRHKFTYEAPTELCQTGSLSLSTRLCGVKLRPASPNCNMRSALLRDIMQHRVVIPYRHFGTAYQTHLQGSRNPKERTEHAWNSLTLFLSWGFVHRLIFREPWRFGSLLCVHFQGKKHITWWTPYIELFSNTGDHRSNNLLRYVFENRPCQRAAPGKSLLKN
jgi:hypothetical protein